MHSEREPYIWCTGIIITIEAIWLYLRITDIHKHLAVAIYTTIGAMAMYTTIGLRVYLRTLGIWLYRQPLGLHKRPLGYDQLITIGAMASKMIIRDIAF